MQQVCGVWAGLCGRSGWEGHGVHCLSRHEGQVQMAWRVERRKEGTLEKVGCGGVAEREEGKESAAGAGGWAKQRSSP